MTTRSGRSYVRFLRRVGAALLLAATVPAAASAAAPGVQAPTYHYVDLGVLGTPGAPCQAGSAAFAVAKQRVVGASTTDVCGASHAFRFESAVLHDLGTLFAGGASAAYGVNDDGDVVGQTHVNGTEPPHAFVLRAAGTMLDLGTGFGPSSFSRAWDVNNHGQIVGERARSQSSPTRAVLWQHGRIRDLGSLGGRGGPFGVTAVAHAINDRTQIVGASQPSSWPLHGFLWQRGSMRDLGTLGGDNEATIAYALNDLGHVVGASPTSAGDTHAFRWKTGKMRDLGTLGGNLSIAHGVNVHGAVVGLSRIAGAPSGNAGHAFIWRGGRMLDLNTLVADLPAGTVLESANAIGDGGIVVGATCTAFCEPGVTGPARAYALVPIP